MFLEFIKCLNRCRIHRKDAEFHHLVLDGFRNPNFLELENPGTEYVGQIVYRIDSFGGYVGFFGELKMTLLKLFYADRRGMMPYVYWGEECLYHEAEPVQGTDNAFLYYFEPVSQVRDSNLAMYLTNAKDEHITVTEQELCSKAYHMTEDYMQALTQMSAKYIRYNDATQQYLKQQYEALLGNGKTLAVHFRGTDYRKQYNNHPIFVTAEEELEQAKTVFAQGGYDQVFLATDETEAITLFQNTFGDKLKFYEDVKRASKDDDSVAFSQEERENHHYKLGLEVLRDQYTLTRSEGLICGVSNITVMTRAMRSAWYETPYQDLIVIDHGLNKNNNRFSKATHEQ